MLEGRNPRWSRLASQARSRRQSPLLLGLVVLLSAGLWLAGHAASRLPFGVWTPDGYEYADIARHLARGEGFTTGVIFPAQLRYGVEHHPSLTRPPLWPLSIAAAFAVFGPEPLAVHGVLLAYLVATAALCTALATARAGRGAGAVTGVAVATSSPLGLVSYGALSEPAFAFWIALAFFLWERRAPALALGAACGAAYLTRYNGAVLLPVMLALLATRPGWLRSAALCTAGFAVLAVPWWVRNWSVTGDPFYSLVNYNPFMSPGVTGSHASLLYQLDPDLASAAAVAPAEKLARQLPLLLRHPPLAVANLVALAGVGWACIRRDWMSWAFVALAATTTLSAALAFTLGRYFTPFVPLMLALGAAGWARYGGRATIPALALLVLVQLAPPLPDWLLHEAPDLALARAENAARREQPAPESALERDRELTRCLPGRPLVLAEKAPRLAWHTHATAIYLPASAADFWRVVDAYPVDFVEITRWNDLSRARFAARFAPLPGCPDLYVRRAHRPGAPAPAPAEAAAHDG